jgi:brefeldin A-inhibited guanine nucleotide-exchange protein
MSQALGEQSLDAKTKTFLAHGNYTKEELDQLSAAPPSLEGYVACSVSSMVDSVCLYSARSNALADLITNHPEYQNKEQLTKQLETMPLTPVPGKGSFPEFFQMKSLLELPIVNENGILSGKFGWCFICRKSANLYCKDTRVPVCSLACKQKHLMLIGRPLSCYSLSR